MKRIKEFFVKLFGCKTPKELVVDPVAVKEPELVEVVNESPEEAAPEADPVEEVAPVVKKPKRKYYGKPKTTVVKK